MAHAKNKFNLKPLGDRVLAKRLEAKDTVRGGIIIPDSAKEKPESAEVVAVGPGKRFEDGTHHMPVKPGDKILLSKYSGQEVTVEDEKFLFVKVDDIIAIIE
jgi:chaperonin GroES